LKESLFSEYKNSTEGKVKMMTVSKLVFLDQKHFAKSNARGEVFSCKIQQSGLLHGHSDKHSKAHTQNECLTVTEHTDNGQIL
jgi:hypothetical protein